MSIQSKHNFSRVSIYNRLNSNQLFLFPRIFLHISPFSIVSFNEHQILLRSFDIKKNVFVGMMLLATVLMVVSIAATQDVGLPLTFRGDGEAEILYNDQFEEVYFDVEINVDRDGWVRGSFIGSDGKGKIKRLFYSAKDNNKRNMTLVLISEVDGEKILFILRGRLLKEQFYYGEVLMKSYDAEGKIEKGLDLNYSMAEEIYEDFIPSGLSKALKSLNPVGMFKIKGSY